MTIHKKVESARGCGYRKKGDVTRDIDTQTEITFNN